MNLTDESTALLKLTSAYVEHVDAYLAAQRQRKFVEGNKHVDAAQKVAKELRHNYGRDGRKALVTLLSHSDSGFKLVVASDILDFAEGMAVTVLDEIEKANKPFEGTAAQYCLKEWRSGRKVFLGGPVTLDTDELYA